MKPGVIEGTTQFLTFRGLGRDVGAPDAFARYAHGSKPWESSACADTAWRQPRLEAVEERGERGVARLDVVSVPEIRPHPV